MKSHEKYLCHPASVDSNPSSPSPQHPPRWERSWNRSNLPHPEPADHSSWRGEFRLAFPGRCPFGWRVLWGGDFFSSRVDVGFGCDVGDWGSEGKIGEEGRREGGGLEESKCNMIFRANSQNKILLFVFDECENLRFRSCWVCLDVAK